MSKTVIRADLIGRSCKKDILHAVSKLQGIKSMDIDEEKCTLTVLGPVDPVKIVHRLKKKCFAAAVVSVEDDKPPDPPAPAPEPEKKKDDDDPCQCQCKEAECACVKVCVASCYHTPCSLPDCYFYKSYSYSYKPSPSFGFGYHLESGGHCIIQ
ncbi:heavy metal-associated isoprenylated plant protein 2-like isoform X2 [Oryza glaberrima]|uniref:heavy metal-associated isoprenylated plant protein 2-like isoform X2 n=1 Tax=Oryza glaberrima TaxID=4538 RepID=UPI00224BF14B|nr:heavy metal-associated isoprenylated plant protein 2-like isoform X2 [Oryza glaberrima]